jgi:hypothetical protein
MSTQPDPAIIELAEHVCWSRLRTDRVGRLAVIVDGQPEIFPVNYAVDHGTVVFRTARGVKLTAMAERASVAFEADGADEATGHAWSVVLKGVAEFIRARESIDDVPLPVYPWNATPKPTFMRIVPTVVTGREFAIADPVVWATPLDTARPNAAE